MKIFQSIFIIITISFIFFSSSLSTHAENKQETYYVSSEILNVRSEGATNAPIIGELTVGNKITVYKEQYGWAEINYKGQKAWVASHLISKTPPFTVDNNEQDEVDSVMHAESTPIFVTRFPLFEQNGSLENIDSPTGEKQKDIVETYSRKLTNWVANKRLETRKLLKDYTIVIDPGHGGFDPGSTAKDGVFEKDLTLTISEVIRGYLDTLGANTELTRTNDTFITLDNRALLSTEVDADAFISIHFNTFDTVDVSGISTHYTEDEDSKHLASSIQTYLSTDVSLRDRGISNDDYYVLRKNSIPATLLELGYISNENDLQAIHSKQFQEAVAQSIAKGLLRFFEISIIAID